MQSDERRTRLEMTGDMLTLDQAKPDDSAPHYIRQGRRQGSVYAASARRAGTTSIALAPPLRPRGPSGVDPVRFERRGDARPQSLGRRHVGFRRRGFSETFLIHGPAIQGPWVFRP